MALTSDISKIFITRAERATANYSRWLTGNLRNRMLDAQDTEIQNVIYGKVFDRTRNYPRAYSAIATSISSFDYLGYKFSFDFAKVNDVFTKEQLEFARKHKVVPMATDGREGLYLTMSGDVIKSDHGTANPIGSIEKLFKLDENKIPIDYAEYSLLGDDVPLGVILAYHLGLGNLLATLGAKPRRVARGTQYDLKAHEFIVKFEDEALIFDRADRVVALLMSGFNRYKRDIGRMSIYHFDQEDAYYTLLANNGIDSRKLVDVGVQFSMWVDPITKGVLKGMGMPTDMVSLLLKATEMLTTDRHSDPNDASEQRDRGQERIAAHITNSLYRAARSHQSKSLIMSGGLDLNPHEVWYNFLNDTANMAVEESNPIHYLKEQEELILGGTGGRSSRTLTAKDRKYSPQSVGVISGDTVDSGEVAAKIFTTADPNYDSLRGTTRQLELKDLQKKATRLASTSVLLAPAVDKDDGKRINI